MFQIFEFVIYTYEMQHHKVHNIPVYNYILPQKYTINEKSMNKDKKWQLLLEVFKKNILLPIGLTIVAKQSKSSRQLLNQFVSLF